MGPILSQSSDQDADDPGARKANFRKRHRRQVGAPRLRLASPSTDHRLSMVPRGRAVFSLRLLPMSANGGGLNRSPQHSILTGKDGVYGDATRILSGVHCGREDRALGSLAAWRVAEGNWASIW